MDDFTHALSTHYGRPRLAEDILAACARAGIDPNALTRDDIAAVDEFHVGGRAATRRLAHQAGVQANWHMLDLGCGIGGPARTLAAEYGCTVVGLDLVEVYVSTATQLTERVGLTDKVHFVQGDGGALPFEAATFDGVWTQHMTMNVADKARLFAEIYRVLRPGGRLAFYEIVAGSVSPVHFPVPWATEPSQSFLAFAEAMRELLEAAGFQTLAWRDVTEEGLAWFHAQRSRPSPPPDSAPRLGLNVLIGTTAAEKFKNIVRNLEEERIRVVEAVLER